ncbi:MAG: gliding motility-associated C-terminal domain-containing protein [Paludibacter sp.]|nr:gliding motility-associated C-terminal domain-containing protein [Paludibacter sp.]
MAVNPNFLSKRKCPFVFFNNSYIVSITSMTNMKRYLLLYLFIWFYTYTWSTEPIYINDTYTVAAGSATQWYGNVVLGSNARVYIEDGEKLYFYGDTLKIFPGARIYGSNTAWTMLNHGTGTGMFVFKQPNPNTGTITQQILDGGNGSNPANSLQNTLTSIEINNPKGVLLLNTDARVGTSITFTTGHLFLNTRDMVLTSIANLLGYDADKYVVTASTGHLVKENYTGAFIFPVGYAVNDYTPATVSPVTANTMHVNVSSYAASAPDEADLAGITRTWNIYGNTTASATISLQHNSKTNMLGFSSAANYITRYGKAPNNSGYYPSTDEWQFNYQEASLVGSVPGSEILTHKFDSLATYSIKREAYYTKASTNAKGAIALLKQAILVDANHNGIEGDTGDQIHYTFTVANIGKYKLTNVHIIDPKVTVVGTTIDSLAPGVKDYTTFTADYKITKADVDTGYVVNLAQVVAIDIFGKLVNDYSDPKSLAGDKPTTIYTADSKQQVLSVTKTATAPKFDGKAKFSWKYTITLKNTMPVSSKDTLSNIQVNDDLTKVFTHGETFEVLSVVASGSLVANSLYNGSSDIATLLASKCRLAPQQTDSIIISLQIDPHWYSGKVYNQATTEGSSKLIGNVTDVLSNDPHNTEAGFVVPKPTITNVPVAALIIPDGFSPNGDKFNDTFEIIHAPYLRLKFEAYNRNGDLVYKSNDYNNEWDGKGTGNFLGKNLPDGTYYYILETTDTKTNVVEHYTGYLTLRR